MRKVQWQIFSENAMAKENDEKFIKEKWMKSFFWGFIEKNDEMNFESFPVFLCKFHFKRFWWKIALIYSKISFIEIFRKFKT